MKLYNLLCIAIVDLLSSYGVLTTFFLQKQQKFSKEISP